MSNEQCEFPKCKKLEYMGYIGGHSICVDHWNELCEADSKTEKRLLKKISLVRNKDGSVVPIITNKKS